MSALDSTLNITNRSTVFSDLFREDSTHTNNVSQILTDESTKQNTVDKSKLGLSAPKLSVTLEQEKQLTKNYRKGHSPVMNAESTANGSLRTTTDYNCSMENTNGAMKASACHKELITEILNDESVIPVEEDYDVMEISDLGSTLSETPQKSMFSHLQPINTGVEKENVVVEMDVEQEIGEPALEDCSHYLQDGSKLFQHPFVEVGRRLWPSTVENQLYTKGCLWSPDGTCLLVPVHLDGMHVVELPTDLYSLQKLPGNRYLSNLATAVHVKEGGTVYDCSWYPYMNSSDPETCCWIATRQHEPIHMWDAFSGELRCSYRGYDAVDEVESAISIIFSNDAQKVIGGYKKTIKIFDTNIPGRNCNCIPIKKAVSCFALTTDNDNCVTAGTWAGYINHYDLRAPKLGALFTLGGHTGGITWLKYAPTVDQSWYLFSGARKDNKLLQWDMRNYTEPVQVFERNVTTNQRIYFDITPLNTWIASGDTDGLLRIWNLGDIDIQYELPLHQDCCNGVSFHPSLPIITTTSGQYHFVDVTGSEEKMERIVNYENSLLMLWYGR